jgi:hypothetical protein
MMDDEGRTLWQLLAEDEPAPGSGGSQISEGSETETAIELALVTGPDAAQRAVDALPPDVPDPEKA